MNQIF
jgi:hypothetical protein